MSETTARTEVTVVNEVQTSTYFTQDVSLDALRALVDIGLLVHVQTTVADTYEHRYFVPPEAAHPFRVVDLRSERSTSPSAEQVMAREVTDPLYASA